MFWLALAANTEGCTTSLWPNDELDGECQTTRVAPVLDSETAAATEIDVAATEQIKDLTALKLHASGTDFVGAIDMAEGVGTLSLGCESLPAAIYGRSAEPDSTWFYGIAVKADRWYPFTVECKGGEASYLYYESTDGTAKTGEWLTGSCSEVSTATRSQVTFPSSALELPSLVHGYTIDGPNLELSPDGTGSIRTSAGEQRIAVYGVVACSEDCTEDDWRILHALVWKAGSTSATFATLGLDQPEDPVVIRNTITLPDFTTPLLDRAFKATVTKP